MIGFNREKMEEINLLISPIFDGAQVSRVQALSSFYSTIMGFDESTQLQKEVFSVLYILATLNEKNFGTNRTASVEVIFRDSIIHKLNRALYGQRDVESAIAKPAEFGAWRLRAFSDISSGNYFRALAVMAIYYKTDIDKMFVKTEELQFLLRNTTLFVSKKDITFQRIKHAFENYQDRQI